MLSQEIKLSGGRAVEDKVGRMRPGVSDDGCQNFEGKGVLEELVILWVCQLVPPVLGVISDAKQTSRIYHRKNTLKRNNHRCLPNGVLQN